MATKGPRGSGSWEGLRAAENHTRGRGGRWGNQTSPTDSGPEWQGQKIPGRKGVAWGERDQGADSPSPQRKSGDRLEKDGKVQDPGHRWGG